MLSLTQSHLPSEVYLLMTHDLNKSSWRVEEVFCFTGNKDIWVRLQTKAFQQYKNTQFALLRNSPPKGHCIMNHGAAV